MNYKYWLIYYRMFFLLRNYAVEIQSKGSLSAVKKCLKCIGVGLHYAIVYTKGRGEQSIDMQGENNKKRGERRQEVAFGDNDTGSKSQSSSNLGNVGNVKERIHRPVVKLIKAREIIIC